MSLHYLRQEKALVALEKRLAKFSHQEKAILIYILGLGVKLKKPIFHSQMENILLELISIIKMKWSYGFKGLILENWSSSKMI